MQRKDLSQSSNDDREALDDSRVALESVPAAKAKASHIHASPQHGAEYFETLADQIWDPTSPHGCEASVAIRYLAKLQRLHDRSLCIWARRLFVRVVNRFYGVRS